MRKCCCCFFFFGSSFFSLFFSLFPLNWDNHEKNSGRCSVKEKKKRALRCRWWAGSSCSAETSRSTHKHTRGKKRKSGRKRRVKCVKKNKKRNKKKEKKEKENFQYAYVLCTQERRRKQVAPTARCAYCQGLENTGKKKPRGRGTKKKKRGKHTEKKKNKWKQ